MSTWGEGSESSRLRLRSWVVNDADSRSVVPTEQERLRFGQVDSLC